MGKCIASSFSPENSPFLRHGGVWSLTKQGFIEHTVAEARSWRRELLAGFYCFFWHSRVLVYRWLQGRLEFQYSAFLSASKSWLRNRESVFVCCRCLDRYASSTMSSTGGTRRNLYERINPTAFLCGPLAPNAKMRL